LAGHSTKRFAELDSLRGLAALTVVFHHFLLTWLAETFPVAAHRESDFITFLLLPVSAGREAVILFFVLSGFVLSLPAVDGRPQAYSVFVLRRIFRIYFPYLVALSLAVLGNIFLHGDPTRSNYFGTIWPVPVDWQNLGQHILFLGHYDTDTLNPPFWTLVLEMRISLVFPLLCALVLKMRPARALWMAACVSAAAIAASYLLHSDVADDLVFDTLHCVSLFVVGIVLAWQRDRISAAFLRLSRKKKIAMAGLSLMLYWFGGFLFLHLMRKVAATGGDDLPDWFTACGSAGLIVLCLNSQRLKRVLHWSPIHSLGKMSYSLYLLHFMVMFAFIHLLYGRLPLLAIFVLCLPADLALSWAFYRWIEAPFLQMGRWLSERLSNPLAGPLPR